MYNIWRPDFFYYSYFFSEKRKQKHKSLINVIKAPPLASTRCFTLIESDETPDTTFPISSSPCWRAQGLNRCLLILPVSHSAVGTGARSSLCKTSAPKINSVSLIAKYCCVVLSFSASEASMRVNWQLPD